MGAPFFILATGQDNIVNRPAYSGWSPNARVKMWNNVIDNDTSVGSGYVSPPNNFIDFVAAYASKIAEADTNKDVYYARYARSGKDLNFWFGGPQFSYPGMGTGQVALNYSPETATQIYVSQTDFLGIRRPGMADDIRVGESIWIKQGASSYRYQIGGIVESNSEGFGLNMDYVSGSGGLVPGTVQVEMQPRFLSQIENSVPAALAAAGVATVDLIVWWQGEADANYNTRYEIEFEFIMSYFKGKSWWGPNTRVLICGINKSGNTGNPTSDYQNSRLSALAAVSGDRRYMDTAGNLSPLAWADATKLTAAGYSSAANLALTTYNPPPSGTPSQTGTITSITCGPSIQILDITNNPAHQYFGGGYGLWIDGPPHPYKDHTGTTYLMVKHSENYRYRVPNWNNSGTWVLEGPTMLSARSTIESYYNNRQWLYGVWANGANIYALTHHEWYRNTYTANGIPGFNALNVTGNPSDFNREWVNGIGHAVSTDGGATFQMNPNNNSLRMVLIPEPWDVQKARHMYGFFHPSNIAKEGDYYYAMMEQRSVVSTATEMAINGASLIRTLNVTSPIGWEYWNGSGWTTIDHGTWQGNLSTQVPYRFFQQNNNSYVSSSVNSSLGLNLRYHVPSQQWLALGYAGATLQVFGYSVSKTLANPQFNTVIGIPSPDPGIFYPYIAVFDENATDQNFLNIGNTATVYTVTDGVKLRKSTMTITVDYSASNPTYAIAPSTTSINEGQSVTFNVTTTNVANGTVLYWTNAGTTSAADFTDSQMSGSFTIQGNAGSFMRTTTNDQITEGNETIVIQVRTGSTSGPIVATSSTVTIYDTSVPTTPTYSVAPSLTSVNEGQSVVFNITTTNVANGTLYWTNAGTTMAGDFTDGLNAGSLAITNNSGSVTRTLTNDATTEGNETIVFQLRTGSTSGTIVAVASTVTVVDTSTPQIPTYTIVPSVFSMNEGQSVNFNVTTTNVSNGTVLYWTNTGTTSAADFTDGQVAGSVTINNNSGTITRTLTNDLATEGNETIVVQLRSGSIAGAILAVASTVTVVDSSTAPASTSKLCFRNLLNNGWIDAAFAAGLRYRNELGGWINKTAHLTGLAIRNAANNGWIVFTGSTPAPTYAIAPSASSVNEGQSVTFTVTTTDFGNGILYWDNVGTATSSDFTDGVNAGTVNITNNSGTFTRTLINDGISEGVETIVMQLRTTSNEGTLVAVASTVNVNDTSTPNPTYSVASSASSINEGQSVTFTITTSNVADGTTLYWTNSGTTSISDFVDGVNSGSITINSNTASVVRELKADLATEGAETIVFQLRTVSTAGTVVATAPAVTVNDTSVPVTPTYSMASSTTSINEGVQYYATITTTNVANGTVLYWTNAGTTSAADFTDGLNSGSVTIQNNNGIIYRTLSNDLLTEGVETIQLQLRTGSISGTVVATAPAVTVNDTSASTVPATLTMNRNDLDFYYGPTINVPANAYLDLIVSFTTTDFFSKATNPYDHVVIAVDGEGGQGSYNPHCGPIIRNGKNLFSTARGFIITRSGGVLQERWNGTDSPVVNAITNTSGKVFNPVSGTFTARLRFGYTASANYTNLMLITITSGDRYGPVVFQGSANGFNWTRPTTSVCLVGAISMGFVPADPAHGCTEPTAPGLAYGGVLPFTIQSFTAF